METEGKKALFDWRISMGNVLVVIGMVVSGFWYFADADKTNALQDAKIENYQATPRSRRARTRCKLNRWRAVKHCKICVCALTPIAPRCGHSLKRLTTSWTRSLNHGGSNGTPDRCAMGGDESRP